MSARREVRSSPAPRPESAPHGPARATFPFATDHVGADAGGTAEPLLPVVKTTNKLTSLPTHRPVLVPGAPYGIMGRWPRYAAGCGITHSYDDSENLLAMPSDRPSGRQLVALKNQIVSGFNDSHWRELGVLTETFDMVTGHSRLLRSLSWGDPDYEGNVLMMIKNIIDANPDNYALLLDFVERTCPEGGEYVSCVDEGARRIVFSPIVFRVPGEKPNIDLVSVMMPFDGSMRSVYETIKAAAESTGYECKRADDIWDDSTVIQDVFRSYAVGSPVRM